MLSFTKIALITFAVFLVAGLSYLTTKDQRSDLTTIDQRMSSWNIHFKRKYRHEAGLQHLKDSTFFFHLRKTGKYTKQSVACIEGKEDGRILLNPRHDFRTFSLDYGPIPELNEFDIPLANTLYGAPVSSVNNDKNMVENSYKLLVFGSSENKGHDGKEFTIDLRFENSKLKQYRVSSDSVKSRWTEV